jgi:hypothetical protein
MKPKKLADTAKCYRSRGNVAAAEDLEYTLAHHGRCIRCGRLLTNPVSVDRSIGPECRTKHGINAAANR